MDHPLEDVKQEEGLATGKEVPGASAVGRVQRRWLRTVRTPSTRARILARARWRGGEVEAAVGVEGELLSGAMAEERADPPGHLLQPLHVERFHIDDPIPGAYHPLTPIRAEGGPPMLQAGLDNMASGATPLLPRPPQQRGDRRPGGIGPRPD